MSKQVIDLTDSKRQREMRLPKARVPNWFYQAISAAKEEVPVPTTWDAIFFLVRRGVLSLKSQENDMGQIVAFCVQTGTKEGQRDGLV